MENGFKTVTAPFLLDGEILTCRILNRKQFDLFQSRRMFMVTYDSDTCVVGMVRKETSEYTYEDIYYIYFFED